jgi:hypothetical protein
MTGEPIPYLLRTDDALTLTLFFCVLLVVFTVVLLGRPLMRKIEQMPLFAYRQNDKTGIETPAGIHPLMLTHLGVIIGAFALTVSINIHPDLPLLPFPTLILLIAYVVIAVLYLCFCWVLYQFVGWLFFEPDEVYMAIEGWINSMCVSGLLLLPLTILDVYFNISFSLLLFLVSLALLLPGILLFYWLKKLFCANFYGSLLLILYLCALEIIPIILMVLGIEQLNGYLLLNY